MLNADDAKASEIEYTMSDLIKDIDRAQPKKKEEEAVKKEENKLSRTEKKQLKQKEVLPKDNQNNHVETIKESKET